VNRRTALVLAIALIAAFPAVAATKTYRYKCPKCKLIQEYGAPGTKKCPKDGRVMTRQY
jgi:hypothetical protein